MIRLLLLITALTLSTAGCGDSEPSRVAEPAAESHGEEGHDSIEEHGEKTPRAKISAEAARAAGIVIEEAGPAKLRDTLPLYGSIHANAERVRSVSARFPGVVRSLKKSVGDEVREGEVLATIESNESLQTYHLTAPIAGVVTARNVNPGETSAEAPIFVVTDLSTVWAELSVFPRDASKLRAGQSVRVRNVDGSFSTDGRIVHISALGSLASQSVTARVLLKNDPRLWTPGLYVTGEVVLGESAVPVAIKQVAVQTIEDRAVVFVPIEEGLEARAIESGAADGEWIEIIKGLQAGESYVSDGSFVVKAELGKAGAEHDH